MSEVSETRHLPGEGRATSVTHWTCPAQPTGYEITHHIIGNRCHYCHKTTIELRMEQLVILNREAPE